MTIKYERIPSRVLFCLALTPALFAGQLSLNTNAIGTLNIAPGTNGTATVQASNIGSGTLNLTASPSAPWLSATVGALGSCPNSGGNCYLISIAVASGTLPPGNYTEYVTLTDPNAIDSPQDVAITVNTSAGVPPSLTAYVMPFGSLIQSASFPVVTTGTGVTGTTSTQTGGNWLQFMKAAPWSIQVEALSGQSAGTYTGQVVISGSSVAADNQTIAVTEVVTASPIIGLNNSSTTRIKAYPGGPVQNFAVNFTNAGLGAIAITGATGSSPFLTASVTTPSSITVSANPAGLQPGIYTGTVSLTSNAANNSQISIPVEMVVYAPGVPLILRGGIVNAATGATEAVALGDIVAIYGDQMATTGTYAVNASAPLATTLGGTQVLVNNVPAPLFFVAPNQINFQMPYTITPGQLTIVQVISNGMAGNIRSLNVSAITPRLLYFVSFIAGVDGVIVNSLDGSLTLPSGTVVPGYKTHPAKPGDTVTLYAIGLGQTTTLATAGQPASMTPPLTIANVVATFGGLFFGTPTNSLFTGLTPTAVGLYQINITVPVNAPLGAAVPVTIAVDGIESNTVTLAISASGN